MLCSAQAAQLKVFGCPESNQTRTRGSFSQRGVHEGGEAQGKLPTSWSSQGIYVSPHWFLCEHGGCAPMCVERRKDLTPHFVPGYAVSQTRNRLGVNGVSPN